MIPWEHLGTAIVPGGTAELRLFRRGQEFAIRVGRDELMNSRLRGSEEALATLALAAIAGRPRARVLIGGLGMGFTLRAALRVLGPDAAVTVVELVPEVVAWARGPMAQLHEGSLDDPRVTIAVEDVVATIAAGTAFDAILLDVDNGPDGMTSAGNDRLYSAVGLAATRDALTPGGVLAVWSAAPDDAFRKRLARAGFAVGEHRVRANRAGKGARHTIWIGAKEEGLGATGPRFRNNPSRHRLTPKRINQEASMEPKDRINTGRNEATDPDRPVDRPDRTGGSKAPPQSHDPQIAA